MMGRTETQPGHGPDQDRGPFRVYRHTQRTTPSVSPARELTTAVQVNAPKLVVMIAVVPPFNIDAYPSPLAGYRDYTTVAPPAGTRVVCTFSWARFSPAS